MRSYSAPSEYFIKIEAPLEDSEVGISFTFIGETLPEAVLKFLDKRFFVSAKLSEASAIQAKIEISKFFGVRSIVYGIPLGNADRRDVEGLLITVLSSHWNTQVRPSIRRAVHLDPGWHELTFVNLSDAARLESGFAECSMLLKEYPREFYRTEKRVLKKDWRDDRLLIRQNRKAR